MIKVSELREKDVINIKNGCRLGLISDIDIDLEDGVIETVVIPGSNNVFSIFRRNNDIVIPWSYIRKIGDDVILVDIPDIV